MCITQMDGNNQGKDENGIKAVYACNFINKEKALLGAVPFSFFGFPFQLVSLENLFGTGQPGKCRRRGSQTNI